MTQYLQIGADIIAAIVGIVATIGAISYAVGQFRGGKSAAKSSEDVDALTTIRLKDEAIKALQEESHRINLVVIEMGKQLAALQAELKIKDETIERYLQLIQNRNPELETFMKNTSQSILTIEQSIQVLLKLHQTLPTVTVNNQPQQ